jgi:hypothetical protein
MSEDNNQEMIRGNQGGFFNDLATRAKLIIRLMMDGRVNPLLKLLPIGTLLYFVIPDIVPGPIDDALVIWVGTFLFVELCPQAIVQEHMDDLNSVIEGSFREVGDIDEVEGDSIS